MRWLRQRMTYANVMSTLAVFIALGGSSYAAVKISGRNIKNHSISGAKLRRGTLTGREIRESRLGRVPHAAVADRIGRLNAAQVRLHCPSDTVLIANVCIEMTPRPAAPYGSAVLECLGAGTPPGSGRRLPTHDELRDALTLSGLVTLAPGGELTADIYPSTRDPGKVDDLVVVNDVGGVTVVPDKAEGSRQYRCATDPTNGAS